MAGYTPMMEQYLSVKATAPDALLFFRLGDFYEMFFEDAITASRELEITLTGRGAGVEERIPMCGVPHHAAEGYIARLIDKGYKVAVCEQMEDPAATKGMVRREIVRIVTPGTVMDAKMVGDGSNNFIVGAALLNGRFGLAACDLTTGELYVTSFVASPEAINNALNVYRPSEAVGDEAAVNAIHTEVRQAARSITATVRDAADITKLSEQFPDEPWNSHEPARQRAVARLLAYLEETQKRSLAHLRAVKAYDSESYMSLDAFTRRNLELTETVRDRSRKGSLLSLLDRTRTAMGARLLKRWIDQPLLNRTEAERRLDAVEALHGDWIKRKEMRDELGEVYDLERLAGRIAYGTANARDLNALKNSLRRIPSVQSLCDSFGSAPLSELSSRMDACEDIADDIERAISDEPPVTLREGGIIRPGYDPKLDELREASQNGKQWIAELERREREATGIKSLKIGFNKVFGYYLEVTRSNLASLPEGRYERKQTLANAERFVTPELKEKEALILEAEDRMFDIEYERFIALRDGIAAQMARLQRLAESVAALDVLQAFAEASAERRYVRPSWTDGDGFDLTIEEGRHPVVESVNENGVFIANDSSLTSDGGSILLITGPNMAGKSTYMRQVAVICLMAQIGCFVPARRATLPFVDRIFTRIGAADDLVGGQSTFMVEMKDIQVMTEQATKKSLIIIDELGRGTSTDEGMAIAQSVIEYVHDHIGCKALVSTHFHELAHLENSLTGLKNGCMAVRESADGVTFLRKLVPGAADSSYGIYCAQLAGLPETIVSRAYSLLNEHGAFGANGSMGVPMVKEAAATAYNTEQAPAAAPAKGIVQLSLFAEAAPVAKPAKPSASDKLLDKLRKLDVMRMTPMQALEWLNDARNQLTESGDPS
ncbi:DNA mismatch repair protein MutS [Cohnella endophytica]|uniref:DNA mismatch repair protein MutS n=1 Tax=Cohnella endophytica TaxID=2419778 RepID=A0A494Y2R4_9BACL|nr:DNA mismatch repair protein MutS [Cohnella endophytica]RKP56949.1 DNA mismatch repair protein MutS [Cohnella endophytica]